MTVRVWHLGLPLILILAGGAFYVTHGTPGSVAPSTAVGASLAARLAQPVATPTTPATPQPVTAGTPSGASSAISGQYGPDATYAMDMLRALGPDIDSYAADNVPGGGNDPDRSHSDSGYTGMTMAILHRVYDQATPPNTWVNPSDPGYPAGLRGVVPSKNAYCIVSKRGSVYAWKSWPSNATGWVAGTANIQNVCRI